MFLLWLTACTPPKTPSPVPTLSPENGPASGYYTVDVTWSGGAPSAVSLGGVAAWVVETRDGGFTIEVQGAPEPGPATLRFEADGVVVEAADAFTFTPPSDPAFDRMAAMGASISAGMQSAGLTPVMARQSAPAMLARLSGAYLGLPLLADGFFAPQGYAEVGPGCDLPDYGDHLLDSFTAALDALRDDDGDIDWARGRRDIGVELRNLSVPGAGLDELADGAAAGDVGALFFAHLFHEPEGALTDPPAASQLDHVVATDPTVVIGVDLLGNDLIDALTDADGLDPAQARPLEETRPALGAILAEVAATGAWVFVADQPRPSLLPLAADAAARSRAAGATEHEIAAALADIDALAEAYNVALAEDAAGYDRVVVVPLAAAVDTLAAEGLAVGDDVFTVGALGGLVGLDGVHFTATGNAWVANVFADTLDATLGTTLPRADLAEVAATDPYAPAGLVAAGLDPTACMGR